MPIYRVQFMKTVADDTGHEREVCQRAVEVEADSAEAALRPAQALFCELERIGDWSQRSDRCEMELIGNKTQPQTRAAKWPSAAI